MLHRLEVSLCLQKKYLNHTFSKLWQLSVWSFSVSMYYFVMKIMDLSINILTQVIFWVNTIMLYGYLFRCIWLSCKIQGVPGKKKIQSCSKHVREQKTNQIAYNLSAKCNEDQTYGVYFRCVAFNQNHTSKHINTHYLRLLY